MFAALTFFLAALVVPLTASAQSTLATISGTVYDEQRAVVPGASVRVTNLDTEQVRSTVSDATGNFRLVGLMPGSYEVRVDAEGFLPQLRSNVRLTISDAVEFDFVLALATLSELLTVTAAGPLSETLNTTLVRTFTTAEIDRLPVAAREFANLAFLTPGILPNPGNSGFVAGGMIGRNNSFLVDGLTIDEHLTSGVRGGMSLETVKEFQVLSNAFGAEYGHAAGAVISVLTRSGTNDYAGRAFYYHRNDRWNATSAAARLADPPEEKTRLSQQTAGGFFGGPLVRQRAFFFGSLEHLARDSESVVTANVLQSFRPGAKSRLPVEVRNPQLFGRGDAAIGSSHSVTLRARSDRSLATNQSRDPLVGLTAPERRLDVTTHDDDVALLANQIGGAKVFNEVRVQFAQRTLDASVDRYCPGCVTENYPGLLLGKSDIAPELRTERRWQFADTLTRVAADLWGDHELKTGIDLSAIRLDSFGPAGFDGAFVFRVDRPFDPAVAATYPRRYRVNTGNPSYEINSRVYALFAQDQWKPASQLTLNLGVRWDYESAIGVAGDTNNIAPRLGVVFDPRNNGRTSVRASYGIFYDAVLFMALVNTMRGAEVSRTQLNEPGYPDPYGPNPNRAGAAVSTAPNGRRFADSIRTPYTEQAAVGVRTVQGSLAASIDLVWARGRNLMRLRDGNYPNLDDPLRARPDPGFQEITVRETEGRSLYRALQIGVQRPHTSRYSYSVAYTLSRSDRDTEDWDFVPQDQRDFAADLGPSSSDARHRLAASASVDLAWGIGLSAILTARSAQPYNVTTGNDDPNRDGYFTDRPPGVGRNSARGDDFWQLDLRASKRVRAGQWRFDLIAEAFNLTNHSNWRAYDGVSSSATFGRPTSATEPREVQIGLRVDF